jgi:SAM-dependent methyltransferase
MTGFTERATGLVKNPRRAASAIGRRLIPGSEFGLDWRRLGEHVTFRTEGFVAAPSIPLLLARHNYETDCIREVLKGRRFRRSLEVGCGFGRLSPTFASFSDAHTAVDINARALGDARRCYPQVSFIESSANSLPFPDQSFDLVTTWTVLQHVRPALINAALGDLKRVAAPAATILLCEGSRYPEVVTDHIWNRPAAFYIEALDAEIVRPTFFIEELDRIGTGLSSPGEVILMRTRHGEITSQR